MAQPTVPQEELFLRSIEIVVVLHECHILLDVPSSGQVGNALRCHPDLIDSEVKEHQREVT